jgi:hypothetical protein
MDWLGKALKNHPAALPWDKITAQAFIDSHWVKYDGPDSYDRYDEGLQRTVAIRLSELLDIPLVSGKPNYGDLKEAVRRKEIY